MILKVNEWFQQIRRLILELASPVVQYHQQAFFSALSFVWLAKASSSSHNQLMNRVEPDQVVITLIVLFILNTY